MIKLFVKIVDDFTVNSFRKNKTPSSIFDSILNTPFSKKESVERTKSGNRDFMGNPIQEGYFRKNMTLHGKTQKFYFKKTKKTKRTYNKLPDPRLIHQYSLPLDHISNALVYNPHLYT